MKSENLISICIPTYNGLKKLKVVLPEIIRICKTYGFQLCISDNASTDGATQFLQEQLTASNIFYKYHRFDKTVDFRQNFESAIKLGDFQYHWLMGNDDLPVEESIDILISTLVINSEIVIINADKSCVNRVSNLPTTVGVSANAMFGKIGNYVTWMSSFIIAHKMSYQANFSQYANIFPHTAWLYDCLMNKNTSINFFDGEFVKESSACACSYNDHVINYFTTEYYDLLKPYKGRVDKKTIKMFLRSNCKTSIRPKTLLRLRAQKVLTWKSLVKNKDAIKHFPFLFKLSLGIVLIPSFFLSPLFRLYSRIK